MIVTQNFPVDKTDVFIHSLILQLSISDFKIAGLGVCDGGRA